MVHDPLVMPGNAASTALTGDPVADAVTIAADRERIDEMMKVARVVISQEQVLASPYGIMAPAMLRQVSERAGVRHEPYNDFELRRLMVAIDAREVSEGRRPFARHEVVRQVMPAAPAPVKIPQLPRSASNQWEVMETHTKVCIPGGVYTWRKGLIVSLAEHGEVTMRSIVEQGVKLRAYPEEMPRTVCPTCDTSWPVDAPNGTRCPMCFLENGGDASDREVAAKRIGDLHDRLSALTGWAVGVGAPMPDENGLWDGQPTPGPGKLEVSAPVTAPPPDEVPSEPEPPLAAEPPPIDPLTQPVPDTAAEAPPSGRRGGGRRGS